MDGEEIDFFGWLERNNSVRKSMCSLKGWCKWFRERKRNTDLLGGKKMHSDGDLVTALLGDGSPPSLLWWVANARTVKQHVQSITRASEVSRGHSLDYHRWYWKEAPLLDCREQICLCMTNSSKEGGRKMCVNHFLFYWKVKLVVEGIQWG